MAIVLGIAGKINSGKTTTAKIIVERLCFSRVSFGDYVRSEAKKRRLSLERNSLQDLGEFLLESDLDFFCKEALSANNWNKDSNLVIDGIRHLKVVESIRKIVFPLPFYLIYIDTSDQNRENRGSINLDIPDKHNTEREVKSDLSLAANYILNGDQSLTTLTDEIIALVRSLQE